MRKSRAAALHRPLFVTVIASCIFVGSSLCQSAAAFTENTLHSFCSEKSCADGGNPYGSVSMDSAGNLYGTTYAGGAHDAGVVFEIAAGTGQYSVLYNFCSVGLGNCGDGKSPDSVKLVIDTAGNLYGTTEWGGIINGGVVFELVRSGSAWTETVLYSFCSKSRYCHDGGAPYVGLSYAGEASGKPYDGQSLLYGTTYYGGTDTNGGVVFAVAPKKGMRKREAVLYAFCSQSNCTDGRQPDTPLYLDASGNIFGTTHGGGQFSAGTVFELSPNGTTYTEAVLYSFCAQTNCTDGSQPSGGVIMDSSGNLFGTTEFGGDAAGDGVIFSLSPGAEWQYGVLADFHGRDGSAPLGLLLDTGGNLIGTTLLGGAYKKGTVFEFNGSIQTLYDFCGLAICGNQPTAGMIQDSAGNLYGTTSSGANHRTSGIVFELSP
ncbi:MAG TPA: choice-of-anchor tandem repeat GloVer-containing protein [Rhizomicrobium sp.]|jgi:uncharacterized repeat protein (TIGR03803 family)|nr:choice-of-anchor tandem repeat GloVer-containing protein [Rhizomicrobium sp.]